MSKWRLPTQEVSNREELEFYSSEKCSFVGCQRNVFVAVHEGDEDCHTITERLEEQGLTIRKTIRKCEQKDGKTIIHFDRCIFHVEKINKIWMGNHEGYRKWIEKREREMIDRIRQVQVMPKEIIKIIRRLKWKWNEELVREFWRLIRKYKDVSYDEKTMEGKWGILIKESYNFEGFVFPEFEEPKKIKKHKEMIGSGLNRILAKLELEKLIEYYEYRKDEDIFIAKKAFLFWKESERIWFQYSANFRLAKFLSDANFGEVRFLNNVFFSEAQFSGDADFGEAKFSKKADFSRAIFQKEVSFSGVEFKDETNFDGAEFKGNLNFHPVGDRGRKATFRGKASFIASRFENRVNFRHVQFEKKADFQGAEFKGSVDFFEANFNEEADFGVATFGGDVNFEKAFFGKSVYFRKISEREDRQTQFRGKVNFKESKFLRAVCFKGVYFSDKVDFKDIPVVNILVLSNIDLGDNAKIVFMDVNTGGSESLCRFVISHITARLTQENFIFYNVNLSRYEKVHFENVYLEDMKFVNVNWGEVNSRRYCPELLERDPRAARDIYRQLKLALDKQENYIDARKFYALEMEAHGEEIKPTFNLTNKILTIIGIFLILGIYSYLTRSFIPEWKYLKYLLIVLDVVFLSSVFCVFYVFTAIVYKDLRSWQAFSDYIVYRFYKITSNFGLSWVKPLMFLFGSLLIKVFLDIFNFDFNFDGNLSRNLSKFTAVLDQLAYELLLLIPGAKNLVENKPIDWAFLKLIYYSFIAYLIYQFVMALRRKVRR